MTAAPTWPLPGQRICVDVTGGPCALVAVVDDVRPPEQLHLREPVHPAGDPAPAVAPGSTVLLTWTTSAGQHTLRATLVDLPVARVRLWRLAPTQPPSVHQRRAFVRVSDTLRVDLCRGEQHWSAGLCDLSEGGVRCVVLQPDDLAVGHELRVSLQLESRTVEVSAVVLEVDRTTGQGTRARLRFGELRSNGDIIRRRVLEQQRRARAVEVR